MYHIAVSGNRIVTSDWKDIIRVFELSMCLLVLLMLLFPMICNAVEMIKQYHDEHAVCRSLSLHGDVVYIGGDRCVIQWNVVTDSVVRLEGYPGLILQHDFLPWLYSSLSFCFWSRRLP